MRTCRARSVAEKTKSSTSLPSRATAWARTPAKAGIDVGAAQLGHVARRRGTKAERKAAWRSSASRCATSGGTCARSRGQAERAARSAASVAEQRGRPDQHLAVDVPGQVDAEEGERRVGDRVDQRAHQVAPLGPSCR